MLGDRGVLLTNNPLPQGAGLPLHLAGSLSVVYSTDGTGDRIDWYRK